MAFDRIIKAGYNAGDDRQILLVALRDSTTGQAKEDVVYGSVKYSWLQEGGAASSGATNNTCAAATQGAFTSTGWVETDIAGLYEFGIPTAALASGAKAVTIKLVVSGALDVFKTILLTSNDYDAAVLAANATQLAGQTITAAAGVTFPASVASPTNITAGAITTVTTLTNLPSIPANWLTAAGIATSALNGKGDWSTYAGGDTSGTTTLLARLTATRAGYLDNLDAAISTRMATFTYAAAPSAAAISTQVNADLTTAHGTGSYVMVTTNLGITANQAVNVAQIAGTTVDTATAQIGVNIVTNKGASQTAGDIVAKIDAVNTAVVAGVASALLASANTQVTGTLISGTYASTYLSNGTNWVVGPAAVAVAESGTTLSPFGLNANLLFTAATGQNISSVTIRGFFASAATRYCNVYAYNYVTSAWDMVSDSVSRMNNANANIAYTYTLLSAHQKQDTGGDGIGAVRIGFKSPSITIADRLNIDQCLVDVATAGASAADIANAVYIKMASVNYDGGVTIDTVAGTAGTSVADGVGSPNKPVSNYADALAIAQILGGTKKFYLKPGTSITLTQNHDKWTFIGDGSIALGGQSIANAVFEGIYTISGASTGEDMIFNNCGIGTATLGHSYFSLCKFKGTLTLIASKEYFIIDCSDASSGADSSCVFVFTTGTIADFRKWSGGIQLNGMVTGTYAYIDGSGRVVIDASSTGGTITIRGNFAAATGASTFTTAGGTITQTARFATDNPLTITADQAVNVAQWLGATAPAMTGDAYARIGANGAGLTSVALAALTGWGGSALPTVGNATIANQTSILNAVNAITNVTARSAPRVPAFMLRPPTGNSIYPTDLYLYNLKGELEDADDNTVTVHTRSGSGANLDANLDSTTMTRLGVGHYRVVYTVSAAATAQAIYFDFTWTLGGGTIAMADGGVGISDDAESLATMTAIKAKTDKLSFTGSGPYTVNAYVSGGASLTAQEVADALKLAPASGTPAAGSVMDRLDEKVSSVVSGAGSGAFTLTITVNDGTTAIEDAIVRITNGVESYTSTTNASGVTTPAFSVDAKTWTVTITKPGYQFTTTTKAVSANTTQTYSMTAVTITAPDSPAQSTGAALVHGSGSIIFRMVETDGGTGQAFMVPSWTAAVTDGDTYEYTGFYRGYSYRWKEVGAKTWSEPFLVPAAASFQLPNLIGAP